MNEQISDSVAVSGSSRRLFLAAAIAAPAAAAVAGNARRQPAGGNSIEQNRPTGQTLGSYTFRAGDATCRLISDGAFKLDSNMVLGMTATPEELERSRRQAFLEDANLTTHVNAFVIESNGKRLLVDTGTGAETDTGKLFSHLKNAGIDPASIDLVLLTHLHGDHFGGLMTPQGAKVFPNAEFLISKEERAFWSGANPDFSKSGVPESWRPSSVANAQKALDAIKGRVSDAPVGSSISGMPDVRVIAAPGHTPGHVILSIGQAEAPVLYVTDIVHIQPLQFGHPEWHVAFDIDPVQAAETRRRILGRAAEARTRISGAHLPFPALAHVRREGEGFAYVPAMWEWSLG